MLKGLNILAKDKKARSVISVDSAVPAAITDTGCERDLNEDRYAVIDSPSGLTWLVCDGMGGVAGGELAAQLAVDAIKRDLEGLAARPLVTALKNSFGEANRVIMLRRQNKAFAQMGTTAVAALFSGIEMAIGWVGDSRAYLIRGGEIEQLTKDHTYVQGLVDAGKITPEEALTHPDGHILTRCIGAEVSLGIETKKYWVWQAAEGAPTDIIVLCTDGLYSLVDNSEMAEIISKENPQHACIKLVELAKERGGYDNITVAIIPIGGQVRQEPPEGYDEIQAVRQRRKKNAPKKKAGGLSWFKTFLWVVLLSSVSVLLVVFGVLHLLSE